MRLVILTLILSLFIGYAEAQTVLDGGATRDPAYVAEKDLRLTAKDLMEKAGKMVEEVRAGVADYQGKGQQQYPGCTNKDGTIDRICVDNISNNTAVIEGESASDGVTVWTTRAQRHWQDGKDYTTQVAGKISTKVSDSVNAKVEPQLQKMRDLRDQVVSTWTWIKWGIGFIFFLFTIYILEPYVSLINTLLGFVGLAKRKDKVQEDLDEVIIKLNNAEQQLKIISSQVARLPRASNRVGP